MTDTLTRVGWGGAEEQAVIFGSGQAGRCGRGRNHHDAVGTGHVLQDRAGHAGTVGAHDGVHLVGGDQTFGCGCCGTCVDAGAVAAHGCDSRAAQQRAGCGDFGHRQFGAGTHGGCDRFKRAGEAQDHADFDFFGVTRGKGTTSHHGDWQRSPTSVFS